MKITKAMVNRKFNLGNYETLDVAAEAELSETDNVLDVWTILKDNAELWYASKGRLPAKAPSEQPKPATPPPQTPAKDTSKNGTFCPKCGAPKKPGFILCWNCHEEEKAT